MFREKSPRTRDKVALIRYSRINHSLSERNFDAENRSSNSYARRGLVAIPMGMNDPKTPQSTRNYVLSVEGLAEDEDLNQKSESSQRRHF